MKKEPKDLREILSFFTRKNFNGTDRGETITNNGSEERRRCFAHDLFMYKLVCSRSEILLAYNVLGLVLLMLTRSEDEAD
ncbi:hypothetical protein YC2023_037394 [Brassica napus]